MSPFLLQVSSTFLSHTTFMTRVVDVIIDIQQCNFDLMLN